MWVWQVCFFFKILMRNNEGGNEKQEIYLVWPKDIMLARTVMLVRIVMLVGIVMMIAMQ